VNPSGGSRAKLPMIVAVECTALALPMTVVVMLEKYSMIFTSTE